MSECYYICNRKFMFYIWHNSIDVHENISYYEREYIKINITMTSITLIYEHVIQNRYDRDQSPNRTDFSRFGSTLFRRT